MQSFQKEKSDFLSKKDKSRKGEIDSDIAVLVEKINSLDEYYTTSSCAGRIVLLEKKSEKKNESGWLISKHSEITAEEIISALKQNHSGEIWLKQEPMILHVRCRDLESAKKLLELSHDIFKRSGITAISDKGFLIEIIGTKRIDCIIGDKGKVFADENFLREIVGYANMNFVENNKDIEKLLKKIKDLD